MEKTVFNKQDYQEPPLNLEIYSGIKPGAKVLDVGCGSGKLGAALKDKGCFTAGIEADKRLAELAVPNYHRLILGDAQALKELPFDEGYFDIIVFADILEHLIDPEAVLRRARKYLSDDGYLLLSVPNAANWQVRLNLLLGNFDYKPGIIDGGHLRFFTLKTIREMLESCGYRVAWVKGRNRVLKVLGALYKRLFAFQFIIKALKDNR